MSDHPPDTAEAARPKSRGPWRRIAVTVLQVVCLAYVARVMYRQRAELGAALDLNLTTLSAIFFLMPVAQVQRVYEFMLMLRRLGVREPFFQGFLLNSAGVLLNHLPFNAGLFMRAAVLKRDHALPYASYLSLLTVSALTNLAVAAALGLAAILLAGNAHDPEVPLALVFGVILGGCVAAFLLPTSLVPKGDHFVWRRLRAFATGLDLLRGSGGVFVVAALAFSRMLAGAVRIWFCFDALGTELSLLQACALAAASIVLSLVNLTPGNLGLREVGLAALSDQLGISYAIGMAAASIDRVVLLVYVVVSGLPGLYALRRRGPFKDPSGTA